MLVKLEAIQINEYWSVLFEMIKKGLPIHLQYSINSNDLLTSLISGAMQCWVIMEGEKVHAVGTTAATKDPHTGQKSLLIYSAAGTHFVTDEMWVSAFTVLHDYAKSCGCSSIFAYTSVSRLINIASKLGFDVDTHVISTEV